MKDYIKWTIVGAVLVLGIVSNYIEQLSPFLRVVAVLVAFLMAIGVARTTSYGKKTWVFILSSQGEARKVVWPTRQETIQASIIVVIMVAIMSLILWGFDNILFKMMAWVTGQEV